MIIPSINCPNFEAAREQIEKAEGFAEWIHIDVSDGKFTPFVSWGNPLEFQKIKTKAKTEVHLMVENPDAIFESWFKAGAKRIIVHLESVKNPEAILEVAKSYDAEVMLAILPDTSAQALLPYAKRFQYFQILCVSPGPSGQKFHEASLEKVKFLQEKLPGATIEVDGGINLETDRLAKDAGADILVSGAYIMESFDPKSAYRELEAI